MAYDDDGSVGGVGGNKRKSLFARYNEIMNMEDTARAVYDAPQRLLDGEALPAEAGNSKNVGERIAVRESQEAHATELYYSDGIDLLGKSKTTDKPVEASSNKEWYGRREEEEAERKARAPRTDLIGAFFKR